VTPPIRRLAGRFLLERQLRATAIADLWLALDEKLNRSVAVYLMASGSPSTSEVLAAARLAAGVPDTRFVQVLDAVDDGTSAYVVTEWLTDAVDLATRLSVGPMPSWEAVALACEVAEAMASAHAFGLTHQRLDPHNVLRTESGQVKIHGLRLEAALSELVPASTDDARTADVRGIGALLYAALTARWPYEEAYGLAPAPQDALGPVTPASLRPDVPPEVDSVAMRLLSAGVPLPDAAPPPAPSDGEEETLNVPRLPLASCEEAVEALSGLRRSRPKPTAPPQSRYPAAPRGQSRGGPPVPSYEPTYRYGPHPGSHPDESAGRSDDTGIVRHGPGISAGNEGTSRRALVAVVGVLALAGSGLLGWRYHGQGDQSAGPSASPTATSQAPATRLGIVDASLWQASNSNEHADAVKNTITGASPAWSTSGYFDGPKLAPFKPGTGIVYDLGKVRKVHHVKVTIGYEGATLELQAAGSTVTEVPPVLPGGRPAGFSVVVVKEATSTDVTLAPSQPVQTRFVLVWFTSLPRLGSKGGGGGPYWDTIKLVQVFGSE
jgi:hypothetical protein